MTPDQLSAKFFDTYSLQPDAVMSAPGRVNLIGEFTDYNDGFVLPCAIGMRNYIAFRKRSDKQLNIVSVNYGGERDSYSISDPIERTDKRWANYVRGVAHAMQKRNISLAGVDMLMFGDVPQGGALSSSAALEVCVAAVLNEVSGANLSKVELARIGQQAENEFMDCQCGIMDQMISACGVDGHALLIDCRDYSQQAIPIPANLSIVIVNSNYPRQLVDSEYNARRKDCEEAAAAMGLASLRDANLSMLSDAKSHMSKNAFKRARHVISENDRTQAAAKALSENNFSELREHIIASHESMHVDYEVTVPPTDGLVRICQDVLGNNGAARQTGGGFGGCIVALCPPDAVQGVLSAIDERYEKRFALQATCFVSKAADGLAKLPRVNEQ